MLAVIEGASHSLSIENEEMGDWTITDAIVAAARRGVKVEVTMTKDSSYDSDWRAIVSAGGHVHLYRDSVSTCTSTRRRLSPMPASMIKTDLPREHQFLACLHGLQPRARHRHERLRR